MRLIDADALKDALIKRTGLKWDWLLTMIPCCRAIDEAPTIHSEPPKRGKWINDGDPLMITCGNCGYSVIRYNNTPFCPNCGAKMEKIYD